MSSSLQHVTRLYPDGQKYVGTIRADLFDGHGTFIYRNGQQYDGEWRSGVRHGHGVVITPDGDRHEGYWVNNVMQDVEDVQVGRFEDAGDAARPPSSRRAKAYFSVSDSELVIYDISARGVPDMDATSSGSLKGADPYVRMILLGGDEPSADTEFIRNEKNPHWKATLVLPLPNWAFSSDSSVPQLMVQLFDKDFKKADDRIAEATVTLPLVLAERFGDEVVQKISLDGVLFPGHVHDSTSAPRKVPPIPLTFKAKLQKKR
uniref:C2 domain-containing protein n=1 Tax=Chrysotila carterae TaxID=13221 RepID=A0A7S4ES20_CHRCT